MIDLLSASVAEVLRACDRAAGVHDGTGAQRLVDDIDRSAVARRRRPDDARRTLAGRAAVRLVAAARLGVDVADAASLTLVRTCTVCGVPHGRARGPGLTASSSSSYDHVLVAVADDAASVGVCVERIPERLFSTTDVVALHPAERGVPSRVASAIDLRIGRWVEKDAVRRSVGTGRESPLNMLRPVPRLVCDVSLVGDVVVDPSDGGTSPRQAPLVSSAWL